jgi:hypothetical protein
VKDAFDVMDVGRMAVVADPTGAVFCLWEPTRHKGATQQPLGTPGTVSWYELLTHDVETVSRFYTKLFGWKSEPMDVGMPYTVFALGAQQVGGAMSLPEALLAQKVPPHWGIYFAVKSCDESVATAKRLGAKVVNGPMDIPSVGRVATLLDPQGATFSVHQPAPR